MSGNFITFATKRLGNPPPPPPPLSSPTPPLCPVPAEIIIIIINNWEIPSHMDDGKFSSAGINWEGELGGGGGEGGRANMIGKISQTQSMDFSFVSSLARPAAGQPFFFLKKKTRVQAPELGSFVSVRPPNLPTRPVYVHVHVQYLARSCICCRPAPPSPQDFSHCACA